MEAVLLAVVLAAAVALLAGVILAVASVVFAVPKDETVEALKEVLPGANCGACGFSGCEGYAAAMAHDGAKVGLCSPGGEACAAATAAILGVEGNVIKKVARLRCAGCEEMAPREFTYVGVPSCAAAVKFYGGDKQCAYGCLGYGDCAAVCEYGAITLENGTAVIDETLCVGCGQCAAACPKALIALQERKNTALVRCRNRDKGAQARKVCKAACIGCMKCQKVCEAGAITVESFLATVDPDKCTACGKCVEACPQGCIV
ncbi:MAG: RnfABCDGE type electron transport complex subunit B [Clostridia bacterium]|nr:RnfABCDGE type electron transport complex subunit B [Clostridia bacterium]